MMNTPIICFGATRSGKTLLARTLAELPEFVHLFESITIWDIGRSQFRDARRAPEEATSRVIERIRRELARRSDAEKGSRLVEDLPHLAFRLEFVQRVLPEAKFVFVTRDPLKALPEMKHGWTRKNVLRRTLRTRVAGQRSASLKVSRVVPYAANWALNFFWARLGSANRSWGPTVPGQVEFARSHSLIEIIAYQWARMIEYSLAGIEKLPSERVKIVRFEDLTERPQETADQIASFAEVESGDLRDASARVVNLEAAPGRAALVTPEEWELALRIIRAMQVRLGYAG